MPKVFLLIGLFIMISVSSPYVWSYKDNEMLVLDMRNVPELPKRFRQSSPLPRQQGNINWQGFADLKMLGSGQFSKASFEKILQKLKLKDLTVIDLRQESHGFLNGNAISWYGFRNALNANKKGTQIELSEANALKELEAKESAVAKQILKKEGGKILKYKDVEFSVHNIASEEDYILQQHLNYIRLYVQDFHAPNEAQVDRFVTVVNALPKDQWLYFHCRAGVGRTSTFMVMYDMMRNAKSISFDEILARQVALGGKDLAKMPDKKQFKYQAAVERLAFLKSFYTYAHDNKDNFQTPWRTWKRKHISEK